MAEMIDVTFDDGRRIAVQRCAAIHQTTYNCKFEHYERCSLPVTHRGIHTAIHEDRLISSWK